MSSNAATPLARWHTGRLYRMAITAGAFTLLLGILGGGYYVHLEQQDAREKQRRSEERQKRKEVADRLYEGLGKACEGGVLRGAAVFAVQPDENDNRLLVSGCVDRPGQAEQLRQEADTLWDNDPAGPKGEIADNFAPYPLRSNHLPKLRGQIRAAVNRVAPGAIVSTDDLYFDAERRVRVVGLCVVPGGAGAKAGAIREEIGKQVTAFLSADEPIPGVPVPGVCVEPPYFLLADNPIAELAKALKEDHRFKGVVLGGLRFDDEGRLHLEGIGSGNDQGEALAGLMGNTLKEDFVRRQDLASFKREIRADLVVVDADRVPSLLQAVLAGSGDPRANGLRLDGVEFCHDASGLVASWKGVCIRPGTSLIDLTQLIAEAIEREPAVGLKGIRLRHDVGDAAAPKIKVSEKSAVDELQKLVTATPALTGVVVKRGSFDKDGQLVLTLGEIDSDGECREVEKLAQTLEAGRKGARAAPSAPEKQDEEEEEEGAGGDGGKITREDFFLKIQGQLARHPTFRRVRFTRAGPDEGKMRVYGECLDPGIDEAKLKEFFVEKLKERYNPFLGGNSDSIVLPKTFKRDRDPLQVWQEAAASKRLAGVLFADAYFLADRQRTLQILGLVDNTKQQEEARRLVTEEGGVDFSPLPLREDKDEPWLIRLQRHLSKAEGRSDGQLLRRTRLSLVGWEYDASGKPKVSLRAVTFQPPPPAAKEKPEMEKLLKDQLSKPVADLVGELRTSLERRKAARKDSKEPKRDGPSESEKIDRILGRLPVGDAPEKGVSVNDFTPPKDPILDLRDQLARAEKEVEGLQGLVLADHFFDEQGTLQIEGIAREDRQRKELQKAIEKALKDIPDSGAGVVVEKVGLLTEDELRAHLQEVFAGDKRNVHPRRTRLDEVHFRYHAEKDKGEPELRLHFKGVCLLVRDSDKKAAQEALGKSLADLTTEFVKEKKKLPLPADPGGKDERLVIDIEGVTFPGSPRAELQKLVTDTPRLSGVVVNDIFFGPDRKLVIDLGLIDSEDERKEVERMARALKGVQEIEPSSPPPEPPGHEEEETSPEDRPRSREAIRQQLQKQLSEDAVGRFVRCDGFGWQYTQGDRTLVLKGQSLKTRAAAQEKLAEFFKHHFPLAMDRPGYEIVKVALDQPAFLFPARGATSQWQAGLADLEQLDGSLLRDAHYTAEGTLRIDLIPGDAGRERLLEDRFRSHLDPSWLDPKRREVPAAVDLHLGTPLQWSELIRKVREQFAADENDLLARRTRLDRAYYLYDEDESCFRIHWEGVCVHPAARPGESVKGRLRQRLRDAVKVRPSLPEAGEPDTGEVTPFETPSRTLQRGLAASEANNGILFDDAWYDADGRLHLNYLVSNSEQVETVAALVRKRVEEGAVKPRVVSRSYLLEKPRVVDLAGLLRHLQGKLFEWGTTRARLDRAYFVYPEDRPPVVQLTLGGVFLKPSLSADEEAKLGQRLTDESRASYLSQPLRAGKLEVVPGLLAVDNPGPRLQRDVAERPVLDGVGISDGYFDRNGDLVFPGVWRDKGQEKDLRQTADAALAFWPGQDEHHAIRFDCKELATDQVLLHLRKWAAYSLREVWLNRIYFGPDGILTLRGYSPDPGTDAPVIGAELRKRLEEHPQLNGRFRLETLLRGAAADPNRPVGLPAAEGPRVNLHQREAVLPRLRTLFQSPVLQDQPLVLGEISRQWDGLLLERAYYAPSGEFVVEGLCDGANQRAALGRMLTSLGASGPFHDSFAGGVSAAGLRELPLAPMLARIGLILPAYPAFDGLAVEGAGHDDRQRLILRVRVIGSDPSAAAEQALREQVAEHPVWRVRVADGLRFEVLSREPRSANFAAYYRERAIADLRKAMRESGGSCWPASPSPAFGQALQQASLSLQHDPDDSTTWFVRAMVYLAQQELVPAARDLRRMRALELDPGRGLGRENRRLYRVESLQGDARRNEGLIQARVTLALRAGEGETLRIVDRR